MPLIFYSCRFWSGVKYQVRFGIGIGISNLRGPGVLQKASPTHTTLATKKNYSIVDIRERNRELLFGSFVKRNTNETLLFCSS